MTSLFIKQRKYLVAGSLFFFFIIVAGYYQHDWKHEEEGIMRTIDARLETAASALPLLLAEDFHDRAFQEGAISKGEELENRLRVNAFVESLGLRFAQALVRKGDRFYFTAPTVSESEAKEQESWYFYPYDDAPDVFYDVWNSGGRMFLTYKDQWGFYRSIITRKYSPQGKPYLVVIDFDMESVQSLLSRGKIHPLGSLLLILLATLPLGYTLLKTFSDMKLFNTELEEAKKHLEELVGRQQLTIVDTQRALTEGEAVLRLNETLNQNSLAGHLVFDEQGNIQEINRTAFELLIPGKEPGEELKEAPGWEARLFETFCPRSLTGKNGMSAERVSSGAEEYVVERRDGTFLTVVARVGTLKGQEGKANRLFVSLYDNTEVKRSKERMDYMLSHDAHTALPNRLGFLQKIREMSEQKEEPAIFVFALRDFKRINQALGNNTGDEILQSLARRLQKVLRAEELPAHFSGVEFAVASSAIQNKDGAKELADRILSTLKAPFVVGGKEFFLAGHVGVALQNAERTSEENLAGAALAATEAKRGGRESILFYSEHLQAENVRAIELEHLLREAIRKKAFDVHFQPIMDIGTSQCRGVEALARWGADDGQSISPADFIQIAETTGLIFSLSEILFERSAEHFLRIMQINPDIYLSLNISTVLFEEGIVEKLLIMFVEEKGLAPQNVVLEITETAFIADVEGCRATLERLVKRGYQIAIDDFGVGNSSISYLHSFPISKLKIDRMFVQNIDVLQADWTLIQGILRMCEVLQIDVVAEGVETARQEALLKDLNCPMGQGYFYSKPMKVEHCIEQMRLLSQNRDG